MNSAPEAGLASLLASRGRGGDTMLVHMGPEEVQGLQSIALAHGGSLTINPVTGMVEANFLKKLLPAIAGFTLNSLFPGMGTLGTSLLVGGATGLIEGDLKKGIKAGMGAYSGANIRQALAQAGQAAKAEAAKKLTGSALSGPSKVDVEMPLGQDILEMTAPKAAVAPTVTPTPALNLAQPKGILDRVGQSKFGQSDMGAGIMSLFRPGGGERMVKYLGGPNQAGMTFAPIMSAIDEAEQERNAKKMRQIAEGENYFYIPGEFNKQSGKFEPGRYVDAKGNPYTKPFKWGFADGGVIPSRGNMYPMARLQAGGMGGYDTPIDSMSGQESPVTNFAEGGKVDPLEEYYKSLLAPPSSTNPNQADVDANTKYVDEWNKIFAGGMRDFGGKGDSAASYYQASTAPAPVYDARAESDPFDTTTPVKESPIDELPVKTKEPEPVNTFKPPEAPPADPITFQPNPEPSPIDDFLEQYPVAPVVEPPKAEPPKAEPPQQTVTKVEEIIPGTVEGGGFELDTGPVPSDFVEPEPVETPRTGTVTVEEDVTLFKPEPNKPTSIEEFLAATDPNKAKEPEKDYFSTFTPAEPEPVTIAPEPPPYTETYGSTPAIDEYLAATDPNKPKEPEKDYFSTFTPPETRPTTIDDFLRDNPVESVDNDTAQQNWMGKALDYLESSGGTTGGSIAAARSIYQDWKDGKLSWDSAKSALKGFVEGFIPGSEKVFKKPEEAPKETPPVADQNTSNYDEEQFMGSDYSTDPFQSQDPDFWNEYSVSLPDLVEDLPTLTTRGRAAGGPIGPVADDYYNFGFAQGGLGALPEYKAGGKLLRGPGDGMSDDIPAVIRGAKVQRAALADGEFVIPADVVSHLGNGSTEAGAKKLYQMMDKIRVARTGNKRQGRQINPDKFLPV